MATTIYMTTRAISNPMGDGRSNRAEWRSYLDKTEIPAGFVFGIDERGNIEDRSKATHVVTAKKGSALRKLLLDNATAPLGSTVTEDDPDDESTETILGTVPPQALPSLIKALGLSPPELRRLLIEVGVPIT